jgi:hypothetical protein
VGSGHQGAWPADPEQGGFAEVNSVACAAPGDCAAGGDYLDSSQHPQRFVAVESGGVWGTAIDVPGPVSKGEVDSVSCASAGNCVAGGAYSNRPQRAQGFLAVDTSGAWSAAIEVPGLGALNEGEYAEVLSVSCAPAGTCAAGGYYTDGSGHWQGLVVSETG